MDKAASAADDALAEAFSVDSSVGLDVPVASRQRSQTRSYKVRCPMCETVGYVPRSAAGKEVRCANRECMVPVFTAPKPEKKKEEEEVAPKKLTPKNTLMVLMAAILIAVAVGFYFKNQSEGPKKNQDPVLPSQTQNVAGPAETKDKVNDANRQAVPVQKPLTVSAERDEALGFMSSAAQDKSHNRSRPLCERLTAHTAAECGDLNKANEFLDFLKHAENGLTFYRVPPLTSIAWRELKAGDRGAASKTLDDASSAAADLPVEGVFSIDSAAWLAAALTAAGRDEAARTLIGKFPSSGKDGRLASAEARAIAWDSYNVERADQDRLLLDVLSLQLPVVVEITVANGFPAEALRLAQSAADERLRTESEVAWLEAVERAKLLGGHKPLVDLDPSAATGVLGKLKPAAQARAHARMGLAQQRAHQDGAAGNELKAALAAIGSAKPGHEFSLPSLEEIYRGQPIDPEPARQSALAFAEIARLQAALGHLDDANRSLEAAIGFVRASAPSPSAVEAKEKVNKSDRAGLKSQLRSRLKLRESQAEDAAGKYSGNLRALSDLADARFGLEVEILDSALAWADPIEVWKLIEKRINAVDPDRREPYLRTPLPWQLMVRLKSRGEKQDEKTRAAIVKAVGETQVNLVARLDEAIANASKVQPFDLVQFLQSIENLERSDLQRAELIIIDRLVESGDFARAFEFARKIEDPNLKEEAMQWTTALACRRGEARKVKDALRAANSSFLPTQTCAAWRGFLIGLLARERAEPASASAAPSSSPPAGTSSEHAEALKG